MKTDKVLETLTLENKKNMLESIQEQPNLYIQTSRGIYNIGFKAQLKIIVEIEIELKEINKQLEELTGLNQDRMDYLNNIAEG